MSDKKLTLREKLLAFQAEVSSVQKNKKNPFFGSEYFDINGLLAVIKPELNKLGLVLTQTLTTIPVSGKLGLRTALYDTDSQELMEDVCPLPETPDAQKAGSGITYFRRYALQSMLGLEAEDDDANAHVASTKTAEKPKTTVRTPKAPKMQVKVDTDLPPFGPGAGKNENVLDDLLDS